MNSSSRLSPGTREQAVLCPAVDDALLVDDHQVVGGRLYLGGQVAGEQDRAAAVGEVAQEPPGLARSCRPVCE
jgi:hypothetical protein